MIIQVVIMIFPFAGILALCHSRMGTQCVQTPEQAVFTTARNINARGAGSSGKARSVPGSREREAVNYAVPRSEVLLRSRSEVP